jgi:hypothetical protein
MVTEAHVFPAILNYKKEQAAIEKDEFDPRAT